MNKEGLFKRAVIAGAVAGGLAGYAEAAFTAIFAKLYMTAAGKAALLIVSAASYAAFVAAAAALLACIALLFRPRRGGRLAAAAAVLPLALLYSIAILLSLGVLSRSGILSVRFFLWAAGLVLASIGVSLLAGSAAESLARRRRTPVVAACAVLALGAWVFMPSARGGGGRSGGGKPDVVLVTIDTIRADHIGCYGYGRIETPTMDRLASEGVLFENAICQIPVTNPSHLSILSSRYPHEMGVTDNWYRRPPGITTIADEFRESGYETAAFVSAFVLDSRFGFAQGFDIYDDDHSRLKGFQSLSLIRLAETVARGAGPPRVAGDLLPERDAGRTNDEVISWLKNRARSPFFLWVHYFDPHGPYDPPPPYSGMYYSGVKDDPENRSMEGLELPHYWTPDLVDFTDVGYPVAQYDAEITYTDAELGRLVDELDAKTGDYILVVTGDHGESLTEHGLAFHHGPGLYEEQIAVPLIIGGKGRVEPASVSYLVENVDIAPTVLELAGLDVPGAYRGKSLVPAMRGAALNGEAGALSETGQTGERKKDGAIDIACRTDRYKLIVKPGEGIELYDIVNDPGELRDISGERDDVVSDYEEKIRSILSSQAEEASAIMDYETEEKLRSLGYIR